MSYVPFCPVFVSFLLHKRNWKKSIDTLTFGFLLENSLRGIGGGGRFVPPPRYFFFRSSSRRQKVVVAERFSTSLSESHQVVRKSSRSHRCWVLSTSFSESHQVVSKSSSGSHRCQELSTSFTESRLVTRMSRRKDVVVKSSSRSHLQDQERSLSHGHN